jgi:hypothetical protein
MPATMALKLKLQDFNPNRLVADVARDLDKQLIILIASASKSDLNKALALATEICGTAQQQYWSSVKSTDNKDKIPDPLSLLGEEEITNLFISYKTVFESVPVQNISKGKLESLLYYYLGRVRSHCNLLGREVGFPRYFLSNCQKLDDIAHKTFFTQVRSNFADPKLTCYSCKFLISDCDNLT